MARDNKITIRRSTSSDSPTGLSAGELAFSYTSDSFFIGDEPGTGFLEIGGHRLHDMINNMVIGYGDSIDALRYDTGDGTAGVTLAKGLHLEETPAAGANDTQIATTAYVDGAVAASSSGVSSVEGLSGDINLIAGAGLSVVTGGPATEDITINLDNAGFTLSVSNLVSGSSNTGGVTLGKNLVVGITGSSSQWGGYVESDVHGSTLWLNVGTIDIAKLSTTSFILNGNNGSGFLGLGSIFDFKGESGITSHASSTGITFGFGSQITAQNIDLSGGITAANLHVNGGSADIDGNLYVGGTLDVDGNLVVRGELTTVSTTNLEVEDRFIELANTDIVSDLDYGIFSQIDASLYTGILYDSSRSLYQFYEGASNPNSTAITITEVSGIAKIMAELTSCIIDGGDF